VSCTYTYAVEEVSVCAGRDVESVRGVVKVNFDVGDVALQLTPERGTTTGLVGHSVRYQRITQRVLSTPPSHHTELSNVTVGPLESTH